MAAAGRLISFSGGTSGGEQMIKNTVTRMDLSEAVYRKVGLSRTESAAFVELVLKEITDCLERGETVKLSSYGSFIMRQKRQRIGRNLKTGTEVPIPARRVMVFKPSAVLKQRINFGSAPNRNARNRPLTSPTPIFEKCDKSPS
jgi:integration host factor subunit alpha